jgi:hypothetical protein
MSGRKTAVYYAWSRPGEIGAPLGVIEDRFPSLFESRRMLYPRYHEMSDPSRFDQSIAGFLDHILKTNFTAFAEQASAQSGHPVLETERVADNGKTTPLNTILDGIDTLIVISFDSFRTGQEAEAAEVNALRAFLDNPDHLAFICPHHEIGAADHLSDEERFKLQEAEFFHHGDKTLPPRQQFGGFARSLFAGLGIPVENRFGLHPAAAPDGSPVPIEVENSNDRAHFLNGVATFNLHPHLPQLERLGEAAAKLDVLARQHIDPNATPHPFTKDGRFTFDALLQSRPETFPGTLLIGDATLFSSTAGGVESLRQLWSNIVQRPRPAAS